MYVCMYDGWMDGWMDEWMDGWMGGWMDGWVDGYIYFPSLKIVKFSILVNKISYLKKRNSDKARVSRWQR